MKKLFTLCLSFLLGGMFFSAQAQIAPSKVDDVFQFTDGEGQVIPDGSYIICNDVEQTLQGYTIPSGLYIKNVSSTAGAVSITATVNTMTANGQFNLCFPGNCISLTAPGVIESPRVGGPVGYNKFLNTEWIAFGEGSCEVVYQVFRHTAMTGGESYPGSTITVLFTTDPDATTGIDGVTTTENTEEVARYTLDGRRISAPQKGINIVKYADGSTKKVVVNK